MKALSIGLCAALFAAAGACPAAEKDASALALVHAAGLDVAMLDALALSRGRVLFEREQYDRLAPCIDAHGPALLAPLLAARLAEGLTQSDINVSLAFYGGEFGKKMLDATLLSAHQAHQIDMDKPMPAFSTQEESIMRAYLGNPAARKLGDAASDQGVRDAVKQKILETCASPR